jgi:hypothetical protein
MYERNKRNNAWNHENTVYLGKPSIVILRSLPSIIGLKATMVLAGFPSKLSLLCGQAAGILSLKMVGRNGHASMETLSPPCVGIILPDFCTTYIRLSGCTSWNGDITHFSLVRHFVQKFIPELRDHDTAKSTPFSCTVVLNKRLNSRRRSRKWLIWRCSVYGNLSAALEPVHNAIFVSG